MRDLCAPIAMSRWVLCFLGLYYGMGNPVRRTLHDVSEIIKHFLVTGSEIFLNADNADLICVFPDCRQVGVPEVLVDGRDVALKELEAAGFQSIGRSAPACGPTMVGHARAFALRLIDEEQIVPGEFSPSSVQAAMLSSRGHKSECNHSESRRCLTKRKTLG